MKSITKLTPAQANLLKAAAVHPQHLLANFPENLKGGALAKVLSALGNAGLIAPHSKGADHRARFAITDAGLKIIGIAPSTISTPTIQQRAGSKQAALIALLKRPEGVTLEQMVQATGWQTHTVRGAMAGALKKKLGLQISSEKNIGKDRVYKII